RRLSHSAPPALVDQAGVLQRAQFLRENRERVGPAHRADPPPELRQALPVEETRDAGDCRASSHVDLRMEIPEHQRLRLAVPEEPLPEVRSRQATGRDEMTD